MSLLPERSSLAELRSARIQATPPESGEGAQQGVFFVRPQPPRFGIRTCDPADQDFLSCIGPFLSRTDFVYEQGGIGHFIQQIMAFEGICSFISSLRLVFQDSNRLPHDF